MFNFGKEEKVSGVFGGVKLENNNDNNNIVENAGNVENVENVQEAGTIRNDNLPAVPTMWNRFKAFWMQEIDWNKEIKVELTPYQQKVEDEINEFLHQEITWEKVHNFLFQEISFGRKNKEQA